MSCSRSPSACASVHRLELVSVKVRSSRTVESRRRASKETKHRGAPPAPRHASARIAAPYEYELRWEISRDAAACAAVGGVAAPPLQSSCRLSRRAHLATRRTIEASDQRRRAPVTRTTLSPRSQRPTDSAHTRLEQASRAAPTKPACVRILANTSSGSSAIGGGSPAPLPASGAAGGSAAGGLKTGSAATTRLSWRSESMASSTLAPRARSRLVCARTAARGMCGTSEHTSSRFMASQSPPSSSRSRSAGLPVNLP